MHRRGVKCKLLTLVDIKMKTGHLSALMYITLGVSVEAVCTTEDGSLAL